VLPKPESKIFVKRAHRNRIRDCASPPCRRSSSTSSAGGSPTTPLGRCWRRPSLRALEHIAEALAANGYGDEAAVQVWLDNRFPKDGAAGASSVHCERANGRRRKQTPRYADLKSVCGTLCLLTCRNRAETVYKRQLCVSLRWWGGGVSET
jgi:hypothetical protein